MHENGLPIAASFLVPGLGQMLQGRVLKGMLHFALCVLLWFVLMGWIMNIVSPILAWRWWKEG